MLFKRSADIIIKGHHQTGRPCGLEAAGEADGRPLKKTRRGRRKAVFKVDTGAVRFSHVHCALCKTANNFLSQRNFEGRGGVGNKTQKNATLFEGTVNMTAIMRSSDTQTHP